MPVQWSGNSGIMEWSGTFACAGRQDAKCSLEEQTSVEYRMLSSQESTNVEYTSPYQNIPVASLFYSPVMTLGFLAIYSFHFFVLSWAGDGITTLLTLHANETKAPT